MAESGERRGEERRGKGEGGRGRGKEAGTENRERSGVEVEVNVGAQIFGLVSALATGSMGGRHTVVPWLHNKLAHCTCTALFWLNAFRNQTVRFGMLIEPASSFYCE